jgi:hypothetical protein
MDNASAAGGVSRSCASRPLGAVQTLGGRRRGGMRELAVTSDSAGNIRERTAPWSKRHSAGIADKVCKHLARQAPVLGQPFCGQSGHSLPVLSDDLWQGISSIAAETVDAMPTAAKADVTGTTNIAPNMATMQRTRNQRWNRPFFKGLELHSSLDRQS